MRWPHKFTVRLYASRNQWQAPVTDWFHFSPKLIELALHDNRNVQLFLPNTTKQEMDVLHRPETKTRKRDEPAWGAGALAALTWGLELLPGTIISYKVQQQANVWTLHPPKCWLTNKNCYCLHGFGGWAVSIRTHTNLSEGISFRTSSALVTPPRLLPNLSARVRKQPTKLKLRRV